jgi:hypothetical protein
MAITATFFALIIFFLWDTLGMITFEDLSGANLGVDRAKIGGGMVGTKDVKFCAEDVKFGWSDDRCWWWMVWWWDDRCWRCEVWWCKWNLAVIWVETNGMFWLTGLGEKICVFLFKTRWGWWRWILETSQLIIVDFKKKKNWRVCKGGLAIFDTPYWLVLSKTPPFFKHAGSSSCTFWYPLL